MIAVLDANAAVELVVKRPLAAPIRDVISGVDSVFAPDLYVSEVTKTFWKYLRSRLLPEETVCAALDGAIALIDRYEPAGALYREALAFAHRHNHPVYDALYAILARRNAALLVSVNTRLCEIAEREGIRTLQYT